MANPPQRSTSEESKEVMVCAERGDRIHVERLGECTVVQRSMTYCGPRIRIKPVAENKQYLLHAPGPSAELELSAPDETVEGRVRATLLSQHNCGEGEDSESDQRDS